MAISLLMIVEADNNKIQCSLVVFLHFPQKNKQNILQVTVASIIFH